MTPEDYTEEIILPTLQEYLADPRNRRRAMLACMTLIHLHDALKTSGKRPPGETTETFFKRLVADCPQAETVYHVAISAKHMTHNKSGFAIEDVVIRPPAFDGEAVWDLSRWDDVTGGIEALGGSRGANASVDASLRATFEYLVTKFLTRQFTI